MRIPGSIAVYVAYSDLRVNYNGVYLRGQQRARDYLQPYTLHIADVSIRS